MIFAIIHQVADHMVSAIVLFMLHCTGVLIGDCVTLLKLNSNPFEY